MSMHEGQLDVIEADVAKLVEDQFPQWRGLVPRKVISDGTSNALFRLGEDLVVRCPLLVDDAADSLSQIDAEIAAADRIGRATRVLTPEFVARGQPGRNYPLPWAIYRWISGTVATIAGVSDSATFAQDVAQFVLEVRTIDTDGRTFQGTRRGGLLIQHDNDVASGLRAAHGMIDTGSLARMWDRLRQAPRTEPDVWTHGDLMPGNLLVEAGRLVGVIDMGQAAVADPALDLQPVWNMFGPTAAAAFRATLQVDDAAWDRGKGWAFAQAIGCLSYYRETNPVMSDIARSTLLTLLANDGD
jgi:aminoglycoside phosphotransferase (APT) family kinase protein